MTKTYKNPPIIEAVCEIRFALEKAITNDEVASFYTTIKDKFPIAKKAQNFDIKISPRPAEKEGNIKQAVREFNIYYSSDEKYLVQFDEGRLSIHRVKPYTSWTDFYPVIKSILEAYIKAIKPPAISRMGIRYINEIAIPLKDADFSKDFNIKLSLPNEALGTIQSSFVGLIVASGKNTIKIQLGEKQPGNEKNKVFMLDIDNFIVGFGDLSLNELDKWINDAHTVNEKYFEEIVSERTKKLFDK